MDCPRTPLLSGQGHLLGMPWTDPFNPTTHARASSVKCQTSAAGSQSSVGRSTCVIRIHKPRCCLIVEVQFGNRLSLFGFIWQDLLRSQPTRVCQGSTLGVVVSKLTSEAWEIAGLHLFTKGSCFLRQVENFMISYDIMISLYRCHFSHFIAIGPPDRMDRRRISTCACIPQSSSMAQLYRLDFSQVFALVSKCIQPSV